MSASHHTRIEHEPAHRLGRMTGVAKVALICINTGDHAGAIAVLSEALEREAKIQATINAELDESLAKRREEKS